MQLTPEERFLPLGKKKKKVRTLVGDSIVESTVVVSRTTPYQAFYLSFMIKALLFVTTSICKRKEVHSEGHIDDYRSLVSYSLKTPLKWHHDLWFSGELTTVWGYLWKICIHFGSWPTQSHPYFLKFCRSKFNIYFWIQRWTRILNTNKGKLVE